MKNTFPLLILSIFALAFSQSPAKAGYWLIVGSYRQGPGSRPEVSGITSPSLYAIPMKSLELCKKAGEQITNDIYKPVWQLDNKWSCVFNGD